MRLAVLLLFLGLTLSGCLAGDDLGSTDVAGTTTDLGVRPADDAAPPAAAGPPPDARIDDYPLPTIVDGHMALELPGGTTKVLLIQPTVTWAIDDWDADGPEDAEAWIMVYRRNATLEPESVCGAAPDFLFWSTFLSNGDVEFEDLNVSDHVVIVHAPDHETVRLGINGASAAADNAITPRYVETTYETAYFDPEVQVASPNPYNASFSQEVPVQGPSLWVSQMSLGNGFHGPNVTALSRLAAPDGPACAEGFDYRNSFFGWGNNGTISIRQRAHLVASGTHAWTGSIGSDVGFGGQPNADAVLIRYAGAWTARPFWL